MIVQTIILSFQKGEERRTKSKKMVAPNNDHFYNHRNELISGRPVSQFGVPFLIYNCGIKFFGLAICLIPA